MKPFPPAIVNTQIAGPGARLPLKPPHVPGQERAVDRPPSQEQSGRTWLQPGFPSAGQQSFSDRLLAAHHFLLIPSAVWQQSWNLVFSPAGWATSYRMRQDERCALDTRLHPSVA
jgi:RES domain-containing protein